MTLAELSASYESAAVPLRARLRELRQLLSEETDPEKIEFDLMEKLPKDHWILYNIHIITLGRTICTARSPKCTECFLADVCKAGAVPKDK